MKFKKYNNELATIENSRFLDNKSLVGTRFA